MKPGVFTEAKSAGVYHLTPPLAAKLSKLASEAKREYRLVDLSFCQAKDQALTRLGHDLAFPDWYGANLDALNDCLQDQNWRPKNGLIAQISGLEYLKKIDPETFTTLVEILIAACHPETRPPLWILIDTHADGSKPLPKA